MFGFGLLSGKGGIIKESVLESIPPPEPRKPRKLIVPDDRAEELLVAWDAYRNKAKYGDSASLERYKFWRLAIGIFPEVESGEWKAEMMDFKPYFEEIILDKPR